ncbi:MAG: UDP-N-acetylenolpyruvoylglucosamine reductase [Acidobacteria bacterium]|nr:MAG: UDP-N-acetylenolpyruvoylglucosamine reductase [Acidobacteriota bacterium]
MQIRENIKLASYTTLKVGGNASYFAEPTSTDEVIDALRWAREHSLPVFVLGGGSNLLVSDAGFNGLVLHMAIAGIDTRADGDKRIYSVGAGEEWDTFVARTVEDNCAGVECLSGIPGTVGGTPVQNVGAYGQDVSETIAQVSAIDTTTLERVQFDNEACKFSYRQSRFNGCDSGRYILTQVDFALRADGEPKIAYADLKRHFSNSIAIAAVPSLAETREAVLTIRRAKGMVLDENDADSRSAGSFFKNPVVSVAEYEQIAAGSSVPVPHFDAGQDLVKLAAAWLIEQTGITKGFVLGPVGISSKHTLALINRGGATAADVLELKKTVQRKVRERFGVELHSEPVMLGFNSPEKECP